MDWSNQGMDFFKNAWRYIIRRQKDLFTKDQVESFIKVNEQFVIAEFISVLQIPLVVIVLQTSGTNFSRRIWRTNKFYCRSGQVHYNLFVLQIQYE